MRSSVPRWLTILFLGPVLLRVPGTAAADPALVRVSGADPFTSCVAGAEQTSTVYPGTAVEPRIAVDPTSIGSGHAHLVGVWQQDRWDDAGARGIAGASSFDGGRTWTATTIPFTNCSPHGLPFIRASDPWVSIGPDGAVYVSALGIAKLQGSVAETAVLTAVSHDGARTWSNVQAVLDTSRVGTDKAAITADPTKPGVAYLIWAPAAIFSETTDGGKTWSPPTGLAFFTTADNEIVADPTVHRLYDFVSMDLGTTATRKICHTTRGRKRCHSVKELRAHPAETIGFLVRSGETWSTLNRISTGGLAEPLNHADAVARAGQQLVDAATDSASGRLYVVWEDNRFSKGRYDEVAISSSSNAGRTWSKPVRVSMAGREALTPSVAVDKSGVVGVSYYTVPLATTAGRPVPADYWLATSRDHGKHFSTAAHLAGPFNLADAPGVLEPPSTVQRAPFLGDYQGLTAGQDFYPFFAMPAAGGSANFSAIFTTSITPAASSAGGQPRRHSTGIVRLKTEHRSKR